MQDRGKIIIEAVKKAGDAIKKQIPSDGIVEKEGRANIVTAADIASEKVIIDLIKNKYPNDKILSEETESNLDNLLNIDRLWVIDPIDGTSNFRFQRNYSCISVGYVEKGNLKLGAVYDPFNNNLYSAEKERGAFLNNNSIEVSDQNELEKATIETGNSYNPSLTRKNLELSLKIKHTPWMLIRGSGVLAMCEVASGGIDLYFNNALRPWDNAAAFLISEEAGAILCDYNGNKVTFLTQDVIIGNKSLIEQFLSSTKNDLLV